MARKNKLGYLVIGSSAEIFDEICQNSLSHAEESVVVMSEYGAELVRCGDIEGEQLSGIIAETSLTMVEREKVKKTVLGNYHIYRCQDEETGTVVYEVVRRVGWKDLSDTIIFAPLALLIGFLFGLYPVNLMLSDVAQKVGISAGYLSTLFQRKMSKGFVDYLNEIRVEHACTYLRQNYLKTYEIAYKVGFRDEKYFSKVFKKVKGQSPSEYKKQNK